MIQYVGITLQLCLCLQQCVLGIVHVNAWRSHSSYLLYTILLCDYIWMNWLFSYCGIFSLFPIFPSDKHAVMTSQRNLSRVHTEVKCWDWSFLFVSMAYHLRFQTTQAMGFLWAEIKSAPLLGLPAPTPNISHCWVHFHSSSGLVSNATPSGKLSLTLQLGLVPLL